MTPTAAELLQGIAMTVSTPCAPEEASLFAAGRLGIVALVSVIVMQEAERGTAVRLAENGSLRSLLASAEPHYRLLADGLSDPGDGDLTITALDAANAVLRRRLIALHVAVESANDAPRDIAILEHYCHMAAARSLDLPTA